MFGGVSCFTRVGLTEMCSAASSAEKERSQVEELRRKVRLLLDFSALNAVSKNGILSHRMLKRVRARFEEYVTLDGKQGRNVEASVLDPLLSMLVQV